MTRRAVGATTLFCDLALLPSGWTRNVSLAVRDDGELIDVSQSARPDDAHRIGRIVLPGMPNLHSHAFQRAMAGLAEHMTEANDSFWTWRETMYRFAGRVDPGALAAIAAQLYVELLKHGYTAVCEFQYLHHEPDGTPYAARTAMSDALVAAAMESGIGLTLLPTLYMTGGFDGRAMSERQRRFRHDPADFLRLVEALRAREGGQLRVGIALHSLRAVPADAMREVLDSGLASQGPIHIHIAEQVAEVEDCLRARGARPVAWLLDNASIDARWCLVHATHLTRHEVSALAHSDAVAGLCPTTEANLGDGLFPLKAYIDAGGAFGIGSDSHVSVSPVEELRWLEYGQRLSMQRRTVMSRKGAPSTGENLWRGALSGGAKACGRKVGALAPGNRADLVVLDDTAPELAGRDLPHLLDTLVFAGNRNLVRDVMVGGRWVVRGGHHVAEDAIASRYRLVAESLSKP
ncbi:MAG TPA: formimidoylglutamate deiminase [Xanthomonadales bacterium]|nr:formimidoylglutamate deiminase [Xanthomonadales bacterium]